HTADLCACSASAANERRRIAVGRTAHPAIRQISSAVKFHGFNERNGSAMALKLRGSASFSSISPSSIPCAAASADAKTGGGGVGPWALKESAAATTRKAARIRRNVTAVAARGRASLTRYPKRRTM